MKEDLKQHVLAENTAENFRLQYETVIGLEVHAQLLTESKAFSADAAQYGSLPNTNISVITLGHPGTLPKPNKKALEFAIRMGLACGAQITRHNVFARKNYFYPDLPKGYQITQDKTPVCWGGEVIIKVNGTEKSIRLTRIHVEEDAGKSMHLAGEVDTLVDFNRAGVPLIEIVSEPEMRNSDEAYAYLTEIRKLVRYLDICDGNMEEGSLRCDANISVMPKGSQVFGTKVEVKNMNSIRNVQWAIEYEIDRQIGVIENGGRLISETRTFDAATGQTYGMRTKETMNDYRYFPEPDLNPIVVSEAWLESIRVAMPPLPRELYLRFVGEMGLSDYDATLLTDSKDLALYFEELCRHTPNYKAAANWIMQSVKSYLNDLTLHIRDFPVSPFRLAGLIALVDDKKVSHSVAAKEVFPLLIEQADKTALQIAQEQHLMLEDNRNELQAVIDEVLASHPQKVAEYRNGKKGLLGMFVGEVMKRTGGKADPKLISELLIKALENGTPGES
ncbi:MAG: Asp-tRNA(Asn)/Glu-tRNA(Gln) amidotransferase subunit GatB [Ferruginibacter sp.]|nr:Asp-tRNA(Asn)/Glu-tRNA(Gln) amidotransferase subunit GatB [Cytophagales bacterium]